MTVRALVIDDDEEIIRTAGQILDSMGHAYESAQDQESARKLLKAGKYAYVLLDLRIPVRPGGLTRIENGKNLLAEIVQTPGMEDVPVLVMTSYGKEGPDLAVEVMRLGAAHFLTKPFVETLDKAVKEVLAGSLHAQYGLKAGQKPRTSAKAEPKNVAPFSAERRELVIHGDRVTVCGVTVWRETQHAHMREILVKLGEKRDGRYVRIDGRHLSRDLGRNASNPVGRLIKEFRDRAKDLMASECSLECGPEDIIASGGGGYHLKEWVDARVEGAEPEAKAPALRAEISPVQPAKKAGEPEFTERQAWILDQLRTGVELKRQHIIRHTKKNRSTINRDLMDLRKRGLIETHPNGYYFLAKMRDAQR
jgi:CheY-like chemotaxis protein